MSDFEINFFTQNNQHVRLSKEKIRAWIGHIIHCENKHIKHAEINYIFCNDDYLLTLNRQYLQKETFTDVIAFDYCEKNIIKGDIFISYERIRENAENFNQKTRKELMRVMAHGLLHLLGYKDKKPEERKEMSLKEDYYLEKFLEIAKN